MATHDLTVAPYEQSNVYSGLETGIGKGHRKFLGSELKLLKDGSEPDDGDTLKIAKIPRGCILKEVAVVITDADDTAIELDVGYTDGTNGAENTFEDALALNSTGVTFSSDDQVYFPNSGSSYTKQPYLTITLNDFANLDDATEFIVGWECHLIQQVIATALTTPV